jgi:hypothetical protein
MESNQAYCHPLLTVELSNPVTDCVSATFHAAAIFETYFCWRAGRGCPPSRHMGHGPARPPPASLNICFCRRAGFDPGLTWIPYPDEWSMPRGPFAIVVPATPPPAPIAGGRYGLSLNIPNARSRQVSQSFYWASKPFSLASTLWVSPPA